VPQTIIVNGRPHVVTSSPDTPLLYVLRNELQLNGPKFGCGLAQCGACTVHLGGNAVRSCVLPVSGAAQPVTTVESLAAESPPNALINSFVKHQAAQCGYCINGMVMVSTALLKQKPHATRAEIVAALDGNLCRCGTHFRILDAVEEVAGSARV
jgi:aerobic-type carbon monoxide dehydrogenase small subunit (CoxS/CutS family)